MNWLQALEVDRRRREENDTYINKRPTFKEYIESKITKEEENGERSSGQRVGSSTGNVIS